LNQQRRVVITGIGAVTALGVGRDSLWEGLLAGRCGVSEVESFDTAHLEFHRGGEVKGFVPENYIRRQDPSRLGRASQFAAAAGRLSMLDCGLDNPDLDPARIGVSLGTTYGEEQEIEHFDDRYVRGEMKEGAEHLISRYPCHLIPVALAAEFNLSGPNLTVAGACAAGNMAIAYAYDLVRSGRADMMFAGGATALSRVTFSGFSRLGAIAPHNCQPFDRDRKGMIPGEGAAVLVLETMESALRRGSRIYAEIIGYGISCDAHHMMAPQPEAKGVVRAMEKALRRSGLEPNAVGYISAHGTGTVASDHLETVAIKRVFRKQAYDIPISGIKPTVGHTEGAAAAIEAAACALVISEGQIPPTVGLQKPDPDCDLDYVPLTAREKPVEVAMNNAYGFGGYNSSLLLRQFQDYQA